MLFRKDINGLRAIAVIAVVLFHFNPAWMPGGFAGVDVFFVISGYLMTGIIFRGLTAGTFSLSRFYLSRANRIIPALAWLCLLSLVFGWFYLNPIDYKNLAKHVGSSMAFISNFVYLGEAGYFDATSHEKWLLHSWSLSVEWQFYILYPLLLIALKRFVSISALRNIVLVGAVVGFLVGMLLSFTFPNAAYYLLTARAWELLLGGVAYLFPIQLKKNRAIVAELCGLALIACSYLFVSQDNYWPGYLAFLPVVGSFLLLQANRQESLLTNNFVFQQLGSWSYSIYLWHWPIVVFLWYRDLQGFEFAGIVASVLLGYLSYRLIECRTLFKHKRDYSPFRLAIAPGLFVFTLGLASSAIYLKAGLSEREAVQNSPFTDEVQAQFAGSLWQYTSNATCLDRYPYEAIEELGWWFCIQNKEASPTILLLGNSYANQLYPGFAGNKRFADETILSIGTCGVDEEPALDPASPCYGSKPLQHEKFIDKIIATSDSLKLVVIDGLNRNPTSEGLDRIQKRIDFIESQGAKVVIFTPHIRPKFHPKDCFRIPIFAGEKPKDCSFPVEERTEIMNEFKPVITRISKTNPEVVFFDQNQVFCQGGDCSYVSNGMPMHRDLGHTSEYASIALQHYFTKWAEKHHLLEES